MWDRLFAPARKQIWRTSDARSSDRRRRPYPDRQGLQGLARPAAPGRHGRIRRRQAPGAQPRRFARADRGGPLRGRHAPGPPGLQHGTHRRPAVGEASDRRGWSDHLALLRLEPGVDPGGGELREGGPGRRLHRRRGRMGEPLQRAHRGGRRGRPEREAAGQQRAAQRLYRDGPDGGERGRQVRGQPRRHGQVRAALAGAGRRVAGVRLLRPRDRSGGAARRDPRRQGRRPARRARRWRSSPSCRRRSGRTAGSPPATPAR